MKRRKGPKTNKGFILITSYLLISVLSVFSFVLFSRGIGFLQATERNKNKIVAFNMAEAGVDLAMTQLAANSNYSGTNGYVGLSSTNSSGGYSVAVCPPTCAGVTQPNNVNVRLIVASGFSPSNVSTVKAYESRAIQSYIQIGSSSNFDFAVFSKNGLTLNGNAVLDSYNSNNGAYGGGNVGTNGDVGTDLAIPGAVSLIGNAGIKGDVAIGPGGNILTDITLSNNAYITGVKSTSAALKNYAAATTSIASEGSLNLSGNTNYQLQAGVHRYTTINITGNAQLTPIGPVTIYVDGNVKIAGNGVATNQNKPPNFLLFATGATPTVEFAGNGDIFGGIFAPTATVKNTGNGTVYGAIVAGTYQQSGNGTVHYDEALKDTTSNSSPTVTFLSWREMNTTAGN